ncbi:MAG: ROK family transcriptional regulator [Planctomycetes bacterium]|nr:ROK family transcriptional regulator [Planctomycetota bacterium]
MAKKEGQNSLSTLKTKNRSTVLDFVRRRERASMAEISRSSGLSIMTVHNIVEHFLQAGMIKPAAAAPNDEEKKNRSKLFSFNPDFKCIFTARVGERRITAALANLRGELTVSHSEILRTNTGLWDILSMLGEILQVLLKRRRVSADDCLGAVIGWPGIIDSTSEVCVVAPHFPSWGRDIPLMSRLRQVLPPRLPLHLAHAARYHAYGEAKIKGLRFRRFYFVSTEYENVVGGMFVDGRVDRGSTGLSGEVGHLPVDPASTEVCACGSTGCLEVAVSPRRMEERALTLRKRYRDSRLFDSGTERVTFTNIIDAANEGDACARLLLDQAVDYFATAFKSIILSCDPGFIIIQGVYAKAGDFFLSRLHERLHATSLFSMDKDTRIEYSFLDDDCVLVGASWFLADRFFQPPAGGENGDADDE